MTSAENALGGYAGVVSNILLPLNENMKFKRLFKHKNLKILMNCPFWIYAALAVIGIVLGAAYMLWLYQRVMFGKLENPLNKALPDLNLRELATFVPLIILAFWIGIYPSFFTKYLDEPVQSIVKRVRADYYKSEMAEIPELPAGTQNMQSE